MTEPNTESKLASNRRLYEQMSQAVGRFGKALGLHPDVWTVVGLAAAAAAAVLFAYQKLLWVLVAMVIMAALDVLDGATARATNTARPFGTVLDHVLDRYAEIIIAAGILLSGLVAPIWVYFGATGALMASYVRAKAESATDIRHCNVGLAGRQEKALILIAGMIVEMLGIGSGGLQWAVILMGIISHITAFQRLFYTRRMTRRGVQQTD
jgi:CDP-diacylglycerol--glycerol-3-phosphate 3-phosphatidyltransferase/archaetidylinositol phosphate synthase